MRAVSVRCLAFPDVEGALRSSTDKRIADIAEKATKEVAYHLDRSRDLIIVLGDGSGESHRRMQEALDDLWAYTGELFIGDASDAELAAAGIAPEPESLKAAWDGLVGERTRGGDAQKAGRRFHAHRAASAVFIPEHMGFISAELQFLQRAYPGATW